MSFRYSILIIPRHFGILVPGGCDLRSLCYIKVFIEKKRNPI